MNTDHTLEEVGKQFDVTRERIRQIEAKARFSFDLTNTFTGNIKLLAYFFQCVIGIHINTKSRFGIDMNTDHTLEEVGKQFDVTRERIRQIEAKALRKLRHPTRSEHLRSFLDE